MAFEEFNNAKRAVTDRSDIFEATENKSGAGNGKWFLVPAGAKEVAADLTIQSGTARIESTGESRSKVKDDSAAGVPWPDGDVGVRTQRFSTGFTAHRLVVVSGEATVYFRAV